MKQAQSASRAAEALLKNDGKNPFSYFVNLLELIPWDTTPSQNITTAV